MMTSSNVNIFRVTVFCAGNSPVTGEFSAQRPVTRSFDVFFELYLNQQLSKQWRRRWFETPSCSLWRHCNDGFQEGHQEPLYCNSSNGMIARCQQRKGLWIRGQTPFHQYQCVFVLEIIFLWYMNTLHRFETPWRALWRHCSDKTIQIIYLVLGWEGPSCDEPICELQCMNGGTCFWSRMGPALCACPAHYIGQYLFVNIAMCWWIWWISVINLVCAFLSPP